MSRGMPLPWKEGGGLFAEGVLGSPTPGDATPRSMGSPEPGSVIDGEFFV